MCIWKNWKKPKTKVRKLIGLGVSPEKAYEWGSSPNVTGGYPKALYYIEPSETPIGVPKAQKSIITLRNFASSILIEPPYTERYVR